MDFPWIRRGVGLWHTVWVLLGSFSLSGQVVINEVHYHPGDSVDQTEFIELYNAGVGSVDLGRWFLSQAVFYEIPRGTELAAGAYLVIAANPDRLETLPGGSALGPFQGRLSNEGDRVVLRDSIGNIVDEVDYGVGFPWPTASDGNGASIELINPALDNSLGGSWRASRTVSGGTPGARNSVFSERSAPQIRQVTHTPVQPVSGEPILISAKVTDPEGVRSVTLRYQVVGAGEFVPAFLPLPHEVLLNAPDTPRTANPAFEAPENWREVEMKDDGTGGDTQSGDSVFSAVLPACGNRTLVRYRISAVDRGQPSESVRVPYPDDPSLNFALFVFDGVPPYKPGLQTVHPEGLGHEYSREVMTSVPVYHVLVREADFLEAHAYDPALQVPQWRVYGVEYNPAYDIENWESALVYEGEVYDHVQFRLRQANTRYLFAGKRALRFRFNQGHGFQARDESGQAYPIRWRALNLGRMVDLTGGGNFGLVESMNRRLWELMGVPVPHTHYVHLRVADTHEEAPTGPEGQFLGDFWGLYLAMEDYDSGFLKSRNMADGNLYKLQAFVTNGNELKRHQGETSVRDDSDFQNICQNVKGGQDDAWLEAQINFDLWYRYCAVADAVRHVDFGIEPSHMKNQAWFFEPTPDTPLGRLWILPWDSDISWGPAWTDVGYDIVRAALYDTNGLGSWSLRTRFRSAVREFRDLVWREEVINPMIDELAGSILEISRADRDRWRGAPNGIDFGPIEAKVKDMKTFAFSGWTGATGPPLPAGGRAIWLDDFANGEGDKYRMPSTPTIQYAGTAAYPVDQLVFTLSPFQSPQGPEAFAALKWRIAEVTDPSAPAYSPSAPRLFEWNSAWESEERTKWSDSAQIPGEGLRPGHAYRVRAKVLNQEGYWSHWSAPVQFIAGAPWQPPDVSGSLRISELMYHAPAGEELDFIEVANISEGPMDLSTVELRGDAQFTFRDGNPLTLEPGGRAVLVKNARCFRQLYPDQSIPVLGEFQGSLSNNRGVLELLDVWSGQSWQMAYRDDWYPETDGGGHSLVLSNPGSSSSIASTKAGWRSSAWTYGSPGKAADQTDRDGDGLPDAWELFHGLDPSSDTDASLDQDGDGFSALQEYQAGTDPDDPASRVRLRANLLDGTLEITCDTIVARSAQGDVGTRRYLLERRSGMSGKWEPALFTLVATGRTETFGMPILDGVSPVFYRLKVWLERDANE